MPDPPLPPFFDERRLVPERFVEEVRLLEAAARLVAFAAPFADPFAPVRDPRFADAFALPRLEARADDLLVLRGDFAAPRADVRDADFAPLFRAAVLVPRFAAAFFAPVFRAAVFLPPAFLAVAFLAPAFFAPDRLDVFAADFLAPAFVPVFADLREDVFAADLRPDFAAPDFFLLLFLAPVLRASVEALVREDEALRLRRVLVAADSLSPLPEDTPPSFSFCIVLDLSSVAIDRLLDTGPQVPTVTLAQGNVTISGEFRNPAW